VTWKNKKYCHRGWLWMGVWVALPRPYRYVSQ